MIDTLVILDLADDHKSAVLPATFFTGAICVCFDTLTHWLSLVKLAIILTSIRPRLDAFALWLPIFPLANVDVSVWELTLAFEENGLLPFTLKHRAVG